MTAHLSCSFDYELAWGTYEQVGAKYLDSNVLCANEAAGRLFDINTRLDLPAAWGLVGAALDSGQTLDQRIEAARQLGAPVDLLRSRLHGRSAAEVRELTTIPLEFTSKLRDSSCQEPACHSYAHSYLGSIDAAAYRRDFALAAKAMTSVGLATDVMYISPKNLIDETTYQAAADVGFTSVRANPNTMLYQSRDRRKGPIAAFVRTARLADSFSVLPEKLDRRLVDREPSSTGVSTIEGNQFIRSFVPNSSLGRIQARRILKSARQRFEAGKSVHIWMHPHNWGYQPRESTDYYESLVTDLLAIADQAGAVISKPSRIGKISP